MIDRGCSDEVFSRWSLSGDDSASLRRLGSDMGSSDVLSVELVRDVLLSKEANFAVDRILTDQERDTAEQIWEDLCRGLVLSPHCYSCGARCTPFGVAHADDCDIDLSLTCQQRWNLRNPRFVSRKNRIRRIRRRWAALNGRCSLCTKRQPLPGYRWCEGCVDRDRARRSRAGDIVREAREAA